MDAAHTQTRLLVLGAGPPQLGLIAAARANGIWTAVCDRDPRAPGFAHADNRCIISVEDEPALERLAVALQPDGVIAPGRDRSAAVAARIADKLAVAHPVAPATAALCANRARQREALAAAGVPQPRWQVLPPYDDELQLSPPLVLKLVDRAGQTRLRLVETARSLKAVFAEARATPRAAPALVEEYVDGPEVTVSGFSLAGDYVPLLVSDRVSAEPPAFGVPLGEIWPSAHADAAAEVARRAVDAVGIVAGPSHVRLRLSRGGPEVLQVSARLGANHEAELVELVTGVDLNRLALAAALGWPAELDTAGVTQSTPAAAAAVRFLVAPAGALESVELPQGLPGVVASWVYRDPGHVFAPLRRPSDRAGALLVAGGTRSEVVARADEAVERIRFLTADAGALV